jgi:hypothetical protein
VKRRSAAALAPHFEQTVFTRMRDCRSRAMAYYTKSGGGVKPAACEKHNILVLK